jgi:hypothetical protein
MSKYLCKAVLLSISFPAAPARGGQFRGDQRAATPALGWQLDFLTVLGKYKPGHDSATGFPVRSHHLSGLLERTAVRANSIATENHYKSAAQACQR